MFVKFQMRLHRMTKRQLASLLIIPLIFLITVVILNSHLLDNVDSKQLGSGRMRLVAAHRPFGMSSRGGLRFQSNRLLNTDDDLDRVYDTDKLQMLGLVTGAEDENVRDEGNDLYAFNELVSSRLSLNRALPDTRHKLCGNKTYQLDLPKASIIICFYNEAWSTLLRTVHSVLNRTPAEYLYEIVLVDDASELSHLQSKLAEYLWTLHPKVRLVRTPDRQGLIRARMYGAHVATGQVLVFLDSHCEVNTRWLEPLLARVADSRRTVAIPIIDIVSPDSFEYKPSGLVKGGFNWGLHFRWDKLPSDYFKNEGMYVEPIESPTMAGGLFAMDRKYFMDMGEYDPGLDIWGGENLEISFRIWQCGGRLEIVPCSRVGHIFRQRRPYGSPSGEDTMIRNSLRVAKVWMDNYIQYFFQVQPSAASVDFGNITDRLELRKKLQCKSFEWYLKYTYPEMSVPGEKVKAPIGGIFQKHVPRFIKHGPIIHKETGLCIMAENSHIPAKKAKLILATCDSSGKYKDWYETDENELMLSKLLCLDINDYAGSNSKAHLMKCRGDKGNQAWIWSIRNMVYQLYNPTHGKCLVPLKVGDIFYLALEICSSNKQSAFKMEER